jgi:hypothetical protein
MSRERGGKGVACIPAFNEERTIAKVLVRASRQVEKRRESGARTQSYGISLVSGGVSGSLKRPASKCDCSERTIRMQSPVEQL